MSRSDQPPTTVSAGPTRREPYWDATRAPLQSLAFLLPILLAYELGTLAYRTLIGPLPAIKAESWLAWGFELFGISGRGSQNAGIWALLLPPVAIVVVLLSMHLVEGAKSRVRPRLWPGMWAESIVLAAPLLVLTAVMFRGGGTTLQAAVSPETAGWLAELLWSLGAGLYEELVFRLVAIAAVHALFLSLLRVKEPWSALIAIAVSSVLFALYHFDDRAAFDAGRFAFYTVAGVYLAGVYLLRGFGIVVACHAIYDVVVVTLAWWQGG
ncbi:MAG: CPBP family intramembrane glutamic endopeptidase [Planctomycetota bacterium]